MNDNNELTERPRPRKIIRIIWLIIKWSYNIPVLSRIIELSSVLCPMNARDIIVYDPSNANAIIYMYNRCSIKTTYVIHVP